MKKSLFILLVLAALIVTVGSVSAQNCGCDPAAGSCPAVPTEPFCVIYHTNNCLLSAPIDGNAHYYGDTVKVLFEPVLYKDNVWFYGWSHTPNGYANYGYNYDTFQMPAHNVDLYAVCVPIYWPEPEEM